MKKRICALLAAALLLSGTAFAAPDTHTQTTQELEAKWEALTPRRKAGIYLLLSKRGRAEIEIMNEYTRLGLITEEEASAFAARVSAFLDNLERSGDLPPVYGYKPVRRENTPLPPQSPQPAPRP